MIQQHPIIAQFVSSDLMIEPSKATWIKSSLNALAEDAQAIKALNEPTMDAGYWPEASSWMNHYKPYIVQNGVLMIPIKGVLLHDFPIYAGWATGYEYIWQAFKRGMEDPGVLGIALIVNSGGGEVAGNFDLVDRMFELRGTKPVRGFAAEHAYSAAYSIISVADVVNVSRTGGVGSIGVLTGHWDESKFWEDMGLKHTYIFAGQHKVDGNSFEKLPDDVKARIQKRIDALYSVFVATVARNRGMDEQAVRDTEALTFMGPEAVSNGLADAIGSLDDALASFMADMNEGDDHMSAPDNTKATDQAAIDAARAAGHAEGLATGRTEGITAERTRVAAIFALDEAKDRRASAVNFAVKTDLSVEQVQALLADIQPDAKPAAEQPQGNPGDAFNEAMRNGNPNLGDGGGQEDQGQDQTATILGDWRTATGREASKAN